MVNSLSSRRKELSLLQIAPSRSPTALPGKVGSLNIVFFLWGAGGFFARIIRDSRKLHPDIKLSLYEMRTPEQMEALSSGKINIAFARPLEPPFERTLRAELLYRDPVVTLMPRDHPFAGKPVSIKALTDERFVLCDPHMTPALFDGIVALC